jgi:hypothetical protein
MWETNASTMRISDQVFPKLESKTKLKAGAQVSIYTLDGIMRYVCHRAYLEWQETKGGPTYTCIFSYLGLNKYYVATAAYGYEHKGGYWPEFRPNDYEALERLLTYISRNPKVIQIVIG